MLIGYVSDQRYVALADVCIELIGASGRSYETRSRASGSVHIDLPPASIASFCKSRATVPSSLTSICQRQSRITFACSQTTWLAMPGPNGFARVKSLSSACIAWNHSKLSYGAMDGSLSS